jgi:hypothetical protein
MFRAWAQKKLKDLLGYGLSLKWALSQSDFFKKILINYDPLKLLKVYPMSLDKILRIKQMSKLIIQQNKSLYKHYEIPLRLVTMLN